MSSWLWSNAMTRISCPPYSNACRFLATRAVEQLAAEGTKLILANNNHSGLLGDGCPVWGDHENYLVEQHPQTFAEQILPFLVTRLYHGAGGVHYPTGNFLAAVRPICMELATGGGTTEMRAIHSTAREEHHMGARPKHFRYHQILGDGHRSHFNLALQFGATALAIKAILFDSKLRSELQRLRKEFGKSWVATLQQLNVLAAPGQPLGIHPLVLTTQRLYLEAARRYADTLTERAAMDSASPRRLAGHAGCVRASRSTVVGGPLGRLCQVRVLFGRAPGSRPHLARLAGQE